MRTSGNSLATRSGRALFVQGHDSLPQLEADPLSTVAKSEVGYVGLTGPDRVSNLLLRHARLDQRSDDFFPHVATIANAVAYCNSTSLFSNCYRADSIDGMEKSEIRRLRLRQWIDEEFGGDVEAWCNHYGHRVPEGDRPLSPSYIRQLVPKKGAGARNIGERAARRIEAVGGKDELWLDQLDDNSKANAAHKPPASQTGGATAKYEIDARMLASHVEMLRKSAQIIADSFGMSADQVLASALASAAKVSAGDDDMKDSGRYIPAVAPGRTIRTSTQNVDSEYQGEANPADSVTSQDRRREERRAKDRRAS